MPTIKITSTAMSSEKKAELIRRMTEVSMDVTGAPEQFHTVLIEELPADAMGVGRKSVAKIIEDMKQ